MCDVKKKRRLKILKHWLALLTIEQERDHFLIHQYEKKHLSQDATNFKKKQRDIDLRDRQIREIKEKIIVLETELAPVYNSLAS